MKKLLQLLESDKKLKVLITSHKNPDVDAFASGLLLYSTLVTNFKNLNVSIVYEATTVPERLKFLENIEKIELSDFKQKLSNFSPNIVILTDVSRVSGITSNKGLSLTDIKNTDIFSVAIDHHDSAPDNFDYVISNRRLSCVEVVFYDFIMVNKLKMPKGWQELVLSGVLTDSDRFYFDSPFLSESFQLVSDITKDGYSIKEITEKITGYSYHQLKVLAKYINNIVIVKDLKCAYSYLTVDEVEELVTNKLNKFELKEIMRCFIDRFLNLLDDVDFTFILKKSSETENAFNGSIRAKAGTINCLTILKYLNGGGYEDGGGFQVESSSLDAAINKTLAVLRENVEEAYKDRPEA